ncbi:hypothetical protein Bbelb_358070 [Branchiostoma belcheri]|nr:hypothetical protein Bbelb_358070 [Branchiostoma belcheri]
MCGRQAALSLRNVCANLCLEEEPPKRYRRKRKHHHHHGSHGTHLGSHSHMSHRSSHADVHHHKKHSRASLADHEDGAELKTRSKELTSGKETFSYLLQRLIYVWRTGDFGCLTGPCMAQSSNVIYNSNKLTVTSDKPLSMITITACAISFVHSLPWQRKETDTTRRGRLVTRRGKQLAKIRGKLGNEPLGCVAGRQREKKPFHQDQIITRRQGRDPRTLDDLLVETYRYPKGGTASRQTGTAARTGTRREAASMSGAEAASMSGAGGRVYDLCVVGAGMVGSAAARHASEDPGVGVCLVGPGEPQDRQMNRTIFGAHYDEGRITRALDPDPTWALLAQRSIRRYRDLERKTGIKFFHDVGFLVVGTAESDYVRDVLKNTRSDDVSLRTLSRAQTREMFPYLDIGEGMVGLLDSRNCGHVSPRRLVSALQTAAHLQAACGRTADLQVRTRLPQAACERTADLQAACERTAHLQVRTRLPRRLVSALHTCRYIRTRLPQAACERTAHLQAACERTAHLQVRTRLPQAACERTAHLQAACERTAHLQVRTRLPRRLVSALHTCRYIRTRLPQAACERTADLQVRTRLPQAACGRTADLQGCDVVDDVVSSVEAPAGWARRAGANLAVRTETGAVIHARRVLLATGAFTTFRRLLPPGLRPDVRLTGQTVALVRPYPNPSTGQTVALTVALVRPYPNPPGRQSHWYVPILTLPPDRQSHWYGIGISSTVLHTVRLYPNPPDRQSHWYVPILTHRTDSRTVALVRPYPNPPGRQSHWYVPTLTHRADSCTGTWYIPILTHRADSRTGAVTSEATPYTGQPALIRHHPNDECNSLTPGPNCKFDPNDKIVEISESDADRLQRMPSMVYRHPTDPGKWYYILPPIRYPDDGVGPALGPPRPTDNRILPPIRYPDGETETSTLSPSVHTHTHILPPIRYLDGKYYLKIGHGGRWEALLHSEEQVRDWFLSGGDPDAIRVMAAALMELVTGTCAHVTGVKPLSIHGDACVTVKTPTEQLYVAMVTPSLGVALGGNGWAAKSCDEIGRMAAKMILKGQWDHDLPGDRGAWGDHVMFLNVESGS